MTLISIAIEQKYPFSLPTQEGATVEFLKANDNLLLINLSNVSGVEQRAFREGKVKAGFTTRNGAIMWVFRFFLKGKEIISLDAQFDARKYPKEQLDLHSINNTQERLLVNIVVVDRETKRVKALRSITLSPEMTINFLSAVQEQLVHTRTSESENQILQWLSLPLPELHSMIEVEELGK